MSTEELIKELTEFRNMLDKCRFDPDCCETCPVADSCDKFGDNAGGYAVKVLDEAINKLNGDAQNG